jgi:hypothetical protein
MQTMHEAVRKSILAAAFQIRLALRPHKGYESKLYIQCCRPNPVTVIQYVSGIQQHHSNHNRWRQTPDWLLYITNSCIHAGCNCTQNTGNIPHRWEIYWPVGNRGKCKIYSDWRHVGRNEQARVSDLLRLKPYRHVFPTAFWSVEAAAGVFHYELLWGTIDWSCDWDDEDLQTLAEIGFQARTSKAVCVSTI